MQNIHLILAILLVLIAGAIATIATAELLNITNWF
jgi:hypothetical protein